MSNELQYALIYGVFAVVVTAVCFYLVKPKGKRKR